MNLKCSFESVQWSPSVTRLGLVASASGAVRRRMRLSVSPDSETQPGQQTALAVTATGTAAATIREAARGATDRRHGLRPHQPARAVDGPDSDRPEFESDCPSSRRKTRAKSESRAG